MKIVRFIAAGKRGPQYGLLAGGDTVQALDGSPYRRIEANGLRYRLDEVRLLPPCTPSKIVALGLNYRSHAAEFKLDIPEEPLLFLKPPTAVIGPGESIICPPSSQRVDYEGELGVVIGKRACRVAREAAPDYILGYTCFNDVTARDLQARDKQWTRAKGFDTFAPIGPCIETELDPSDLAL